jgi:hypothetical protein
MDCPHCSDGTTQDATYICSTNDYRVVDLNDNLLVKVADHNLAPDYIEIGDSVGVTYCSCGKYWSSQN